MTIKPKRSNAFTIPPSSEAVFVDGAVRKGTIASIEEILRTSYGAARRRSATYGYVIPTVSYEPPEDEDDDEDIEEDDEDENDEETF